VFQDTAGETALFPGLTLQWLLLPTPFMIMVQTPKGLKTDYNVSVEQSMSKNLPQSSRLAALHRKFRPFGLTGCVCIDFASDSELQSLVRNVAQFGKARGEALVSRRDRAGEFLLYFFVR
jgi:hypothetical protein